MCERNSLRTRTTKLPSAYCAEGRVVSVHIALEPEKTGCEYVPTCAALVVLPCDCDSIVAVVVIAGVGGA